MLLRFFILDCRSSACSRNAFAVSAKHGNSDPTLKRNAAITRVTSSGPMAVLVAVVSLIGLRPQAPAH